MALSQLVYFSEVGDLGSGGVERILEQSRARNREVGLTGVLLFDQRYFLQCLEGDREPVSATFCRIAADSRHTRVTLMSVHDIDVREFPGWTMGYLASTRPCFAAVLREVLATPEFDPRLLSATSAITLMRRVSRLESVV